MGSWKQKQWWTSLETSPANYSSTHHLLNGQNSIPLQRDLGAPPNVPQPASGTSQTTLRTATGVKRYIQSIRSIVLLKKNKQPKKKNAGEPVKMDPRDSPPPQRASPSRLFPWCFVRTLTLAACRVSSAHGIRADGDAKEADVGAAGVSGGGNCTGPAGPAGPAGQPTRLQRMLLLLVLLL